VSDVVRRNREIRRVRDVHTPIAHNDDDLPQEICDIIDALARAAAKRDHHTAYKERAERD